jgi:hypothetical protein
LWVRISSLSSSNRQLCAIVRLLEALALAPGPALDLDQALHPARPHAGAEVVLQRAPGLAGAAREGAAGGRRVFEALVQQALGGRAVVAHALPL